MPPDNDIWALVSPLAGVPVIWANQNAPRPPLPYIALHILSHTTPQWDWITSPDADGVATIQGWRMANLEMQHFGPGGNATLGELVQRLRAPSNLDLAAASGLAIATVGPVQDIPVMRDSGSQDVEYEPRSIAEIGINWVQTITDTVGVIERVIYAATIDDRTTNHEVDING